MPGPEFAGIKKASGNFSVTSIFRYFLRIAPFAVTNVEIVVNTIDRIYSIKT